MGRGAYSFDVKRVEHRLFEEDRDFVSIQNEPKIQVDHLQLLMRHIFRRSLTKWEVHTLIRRLKHHGMAFRNIGVEDAESANPSAADIRQQWVLNLVCVGKAFQDFA